MQLRVFKPWRKPFLAGMAAVALVTLPACTTIKDQNGYLADQEMIDNVAPGVDNKDSVLAMLGRPSITGTFDDDSWFYVSQVTEQIAFMTPKPITHQVIAIRFDKSGNVTAIDRFDKKDIVAVNLTDDTTPTRGREMGLLELLFGNIGRFGAAPPGGPGGPGSPN